jgi:hypothetical protein
MAEGDRLLGRAWEYGRSSKPGLAPGDLELAEHYYAQAAQAYLVGAAEYQRGRAVTRDGAALEDPIELVRSLDGRLRAEAEGALRSASTPVAAESRHRGVERARIFAEDLRHRFLEAAPELFRGGADIGINRAQDTSWSR